MQSVSSAKIFSRLTEDTAVGGIYRGKTEDQHPFVRCVALSDEPDLIAVSILEKESDEVVVSLDTRTNACITTVNIKAKIECQISHRTAEVYATFQNLTDGETRTYKCRRTYFDVAISYKNDKIIISQSKGSSSESVSSCMVACPVIIVLLLFALAAVSASWFLRFRGALRCPFQHGDHAATKVQQEHTHRQNPEKECVRLMDIAPRLMETENKGSGDSGDSSFGQPPTSENVCEGVEDRGGGSNKSASLCNV
ncbi:hypothetical protein BaRGS_00016944 [Batillaria attramentaria]|uniref:Uncharacterized protein n=1 Tax=Batillaria attramentaria TaxID=370345 RepID=A0ABD0KXC8_9CAEN